MQPAWWCMRRAHGAHLGVVDDAQQLARLGLARDLVRVVRVAKVPGWTREPHVGALARVDRGKFH